jgi:hypothetical protein
MKTRLYFNVIYAFVFSFTSSAFSQPVDSALHGAWISVGGESTLVFNSKEVKFIDPSDNKEFILSWINSPPKDGTSPEAKVSVDGEYNVCFYVTSTSSKNELRTELFTEMLNLLNQKKEGHLTQEELNDVITSMSDSLDIINNLRDDKFRTIACRQYVYSLDSKSYDEQGSGDVVTYFFYDQDKVYEWIRNFTLGGVSIAAYSRK